VWDAPPIVAFDISPAVVREAARLDGGPRFFVASSYALPFPDKSFDLVVMCEVMEHLTEPEAAALDRWVRAGGVLLCEAHLGAYNGTAGRHSRTVPGCGLAEAWGLREWFSPAVRMVLRTMQRRPLRTGLTILGIAASMAIVISGTFWRDTIELLLHTQFRRR